MYSSVVRFGVVALALAIIAGGCDKKNNENGPANGTAPTFPTVQFSAPPQPAANDTSQCHWNAYAYTQAANSLAMYPLLFASLTPTSDGNTWTWGPYPVDSTNVTVTAILGSDNKYAWKMVVNGVSDGVPISNWTAMEGSSNMDGTEGTFKIYEEYTTTLSLEFSYTKSNTGIVTGTTITYSQGAIQDKIVHVSNPDGSGEVTHYDYVGSAYVQTFHATWASGAPAVCS